MEFKTFYIVKDSQTGHELSRHSSFEDAQKEVSKLEKKTQKMVIFVPTHMKL